jgi:regulator of replication initiation timing
MSFNEELFVKVATLEAKLEITQKQLYELEQTVSELLEKIKQIRSVINGVYNQTH